MANLIWNEWQLARTATKTIAASGDTEITASDIAATGLLDKVPSSVAVIKSDGTPLSVSWAYDSGLKKVVITNYAATAYSNCTVIID